MIKMISGATRIGEFLRRPADGPFSAESAVEAHLVARGVAVYVSESVDAQPVCVEVETSPTTDVPDSIEAVEASCEPVEDIHRMSFKALKDYAQSIGLDVTGCKSKSAILEMLEDDDDAPDLEMDGVVI